jgi:DNA-binding SARP family transcriptional activator
VLLVHANQVVALDPLIEELWGQQPPAQATASLQAYVSNLRRALEPDRTARTPPQVLVTQPPATGWWSRSPRLMPRTGFCPYLTIAWKVRAV